jgi:hypothetical protein
LKEAMEYRRGRNPHILPEQSADFLVHSFAPCLLHTRPGTLAPGTVLWMPACTHSYQTESVSLSAAGSTVSSIGRASAPTTCASQHHPSRAGGFYPGYGHTVCHGPGPDSRLFVSLDH